MLLVLGLALLACTPLDGAPAATDPRAAGRSSKVLARSGKLLLEEVSSAPADGDRRDLGNVEDRGMSLASFARFLAETGATEALNMDGGISTGLRASIGGAAFLVEAGGGTINAVAAEVDTQ